MQSLLGQFYNRIRGSQEDIASEALVYILNSSEKAKREFLRIIEQKSGIKFLDLDFTTQSIGENQERPDISGRNENGKEVLLIESKFWSSLTSNQPNEYIKRLGENSLLLFLVPSLRVRTVYEELERKMKVEFSNYKKDSEHNIFDIVGNNIQVLVLGWMDILKPIRSELVVEGNTSDIDQLIGLCNRIDSDAFIPITEEDLSPSNAKRIMSYYDLTDKVVDELIKLVPDVSIDGLIKTPKRYGYRRYFSLNSLGLALGFRMEYWNKHADTPFWLHIALINEDNDWERPDKFINKCKEVANKKGVKFLFFNNEISIALYPLTNETEDVVVRDLVRQVIDLLDKIQN